MSSSRSFLSFLTTLILFSTCAIGSEDEDSKWNFYIQTIDPYASEVDKPKTPRAKQESSVSDTPKPIFKPRPLPNGATAEQIAQYNRELQKSLRDQQLIEIQKLTDRKKRFGRDEKSKQSGQSAPFTFASISTNDSSGYSAKKTNFSWGGKKPGYSYVDYEFSFDATNSKHAQKMINAISKLAKAGWEVDLNRSTQEVKSRGDNTRALTTTQMRFRRSK